MYLNTRYNKRYLGVPAFHEERVVVTNALIKENHIEHLVDYGYNPFIYGDFRILPEAITVIEKRPVSGTEYNVVHGDFNDLAPNYIQENTLFTYFIFNADDAIKLDEFVKKNTFEKNNILLVWDRRNGQRNKIINL